MSYTAVRNPRSGSALTLMGAGLILTAALIHLFLSPEHFREAPYLGLLFFADFVGATVAAFGIYRERRWGWLLGVVVAGGAIVAYMVSGAVGLPGVGRGHFLEPVGVLCKMIEALFLLLYAYKFMGFGRWALVGGIAAVLMVTAVATALGLQEGDTHAGHAGHEGHDGGNQASATAAEQEAAAKLVSDTRAGAARFEDFEVARAEGYKQMKGRRGDPSETPYRHVHYFNREYFEDGKILDPVRPETLVYMRTSDGEMKLLGAMYIAPRGEGPKVGGELTHWHTHDFACMGYDEDGSVIVSLKLFGCRKGSWPISDVEMLHVWFFDHPDGPLATHLRATDKDVAAALRSAAKL